MAENDLERVYGSWVVLEASGAQIAVDGWSEALDTALLASADAGFDWLEVHFRGNCSTATGVGDGWLGVYSQAKSQGQGAYDAPDPDDDHPHDYAHAFVLDEVTAAHSKTIEIKRCPTQHESLWLRNKCGQIVASGWLLEVRPFTYRPEAA